MLTTNYAGSALVCQLPTSETLATAARVRELKAQGKQVYDFSLGEPDFATPQVIVEAAQAAAADPRYHHYPPVAGFPELRQALADKLNGHGLNVQAEQVVVTNGAKQALMQTFLSLLNPGDEAILLAPYWVSYMGQIEGLTRAKAVVLKPEPGNNLKITPDQLADAITPSTRLVVLNSPSNPSGVLYTREEYQAFADVLAKHPQVWAVSDEIYEPITFTEGFTSFGSLDGMANRTVTIHGFAKGWAMTGWRVGYLAAPQPIADACKRVQGQITSGVNGVAQQAALAALQHADEAVKSMVNDFRIRRDTGLEVIRNAFPGMPITPPDGAFYFFPSVEAFLGRQTPAGEVLNTSAELCDYLLNHAGVATVPGTAFGLEGHLRISFACHADTLKAGLGAMADALAQLKG